MKDPAAFDDFYKDARTRLLVLTYCLTGDLPSSRAAVRDAFVATWHHWRKVSRVEDPEAWTRARACAQAQRRHTAKLWHRERGLDPGVKETLDALGKLPVNQRKMVLLTELTTASLAEISREVGLPRAEAERELQAATAQLAVLREVPTTSIRTLFEPVRLHVEPTSWPRATIVRRSGAARRRTHTLVGVAATVAALVVTGGLVTDAAGVRPTLSGERVESAGSDQPSGSPQGTDPVELPEDALLAAGQVARFVPGKRWTVTRTDDNSGGTGLVMPCQDSRYADPHGAAALVRTFATTGRRPSTTVQAAQVSRTSRAARRGYRTAVRWFAACGDDRAQLLTTHEVEGVGNRAALLVLRTWDDPASAVVAGVARTGRVLTTTVSRTPPGDEPRLGRSAGLLTAAVSGLCGIEQAADCPSSVRPVVRRVPPVPAASVPGMLAEVDLPPVHAVPHPWVGTEPRQAKDNDAATGCDQTDFGARGVSNDVTRTFLVPDAKVPDQFGLTETVGSLPERRARAFVAAVRAKLAGCSEKQMGTDVERLSTVTHGRRELTAWHVTTEISDDRSVDFLMGITREGTAVAQVGFVAAPGATLSHQAFLAVVRRAQDRLGAMPAPRTR